NKIVFHVIGTPPQVPPNFSLLTGEVLYQLRSALDHLVYQLVVSKTKEPPTFKSAFPIVGRGTMGKKRWTSAVEEYEACTSRLKDGISPAALKMIDELQPLKRGAAYKDDPLWMLQELNNIDKHRFLHLAVISVSSYGVSVNVHGHTYEGTYRPGIAIENGAELGSLLITGGPPFRNEEVRVDGHLTVQVAFDDVVGERNVPLIPRLTQLADYVDGVVKAFMCLPEWGWTVSWDRHFPPPWKAKPRTRSSP
ncbi:MAG: hypothetical protein AB7N90_16640, partial [Vicinamibacterales bacterium]